MFPFCFFSHRRIFPYYSFIIKYIDIFISFFSALNSFSYYLVCTHSPFFLPYYLTSLHTLTRMSDCRPDLGRWLDVLTAYTQKSLLQVIIAPSLSPHFADQSRQRILTVKILQLLCSRRHCPPNIAKQIHCFNWLTRRRAAVSRQPPSLRVTDWLS